MAWTRKKNKSSQIKGKTQAFNPLCTPQAPLWDCIKRQQRHRLAKQIIQHCCAHERGEFSSNGKM